MIRRKRAVCLGMAAADVLVSGIDLRSGVAGDCEVHDIGIDTGGDALNQSIVISKLGHEATLMSMVGRDLFGEMIRSRCRRFGIDTAGLTVTGEIPTSISVVCIRPDGERQFIAHKHGTVNLFSLADLDLDLLDESVQVLSIGSLGASARLGGREFSEIFCQAKRNGTVIVADMVDNLGERTIPIMEEAFPLIDYLIPSREEMICFTGVGDPRKGAEIFHELGVRNVIIKLGGAGAYVSAKGFTGIIPAFRVPAADTTGAGDNFVGGFVAALMDGQDVKGGVRYASAVAALSVQARGAVEGVENKVQVETFLQQNSSLT